MLQGPCRQATQGGVEDGQAQRSRGQAAAAGCQARRHDLAGHAVRLGSAGAGVAADLRRRRAFRQLHPACRRFPRHAARAAVSTRWQASASRELDLCRASSPPSRAAMSSRWWRRIRKPPRHSPLWKHSRRRCRSRMAEPLICRCWWMLRVPASSSSAAACSPRPPAAQQHRAVGCQRAAAGRAAGVFAAGAGTGSVLA